MIAWLVAVEVIRLDPQAAAAARAEGEARMAAEYAREDAVRNAPRQRRGLFAGGIGTTPLSRAHAPLGDVGQTGFVYQPGSIGYDRYRDN